MFLGGFNIKKKEREKERDHGKEGASGTEFLDMTENI